MAEVLLGQAGDRGWWGRLGEGGGARAMAGEAGAVAGWAGFPAAPVWSGKRGRRGEGEEEVGGRREAGGGDKDSDFPFHPSSFPPHLPLSSYII